MKLKINIFTKLFIAMLVATLSVAVLMGSLVNWSFRQGFVGYQQQPDRDRVRRLSALLAAEYQQQHNWQFLDSQPGYLKGLLNKVSTADRTAPSLPLEQVAQKLSLNALEQRIRLLNLQGEVLLGLKDRAAFKEPLREPIIVGKNKVGWLELKMSSVPPPAVRFMQEQKRNTYLIAVFAGIVSLLMAIWLVRQLLRPVQQLTTGAKHLATGHFDTTIQVSSQDELGELAHHFNHMALSLKRHETVRSQWVADISHELRTPIAILRGEIEAMLDGIRQPTLERVRSLHHDVLSLGYLVDDLHLLALSDAGEMKLLEEWVNVLAVWEDALEAMQSRLAEKSIRLNYEQTHTQATPTPKMITQSRQSEQPQAIYQVKGDSKRLYQLFINLLENSHRYTDENGLIKAVFSNTAQQLCFIIEDSAPGVPEVSLQRLFDRLYRVEQSRSRHLGGSGLGLSICRNIVALHGGSIKAEHSDLGGLRICVNLPITRSAHKDH